jgi:hypothetical protein
MISDERRDRFWDVTCSFYGAMWIGFALTVSMLVLSVFSYVYVDQSTGSYTIVRVNLLILTLLLLGLAFLLRRCSDR